MDASYLKPWATPLTVGAFVLLAVTGILMFFHWDMGLNKTAHEWLGWALVLGGIAHFVLHFASFKKHWARPVGKLFMGGFVLLLGLSFLSFPGGDKKGENPLVMAGDALAKAPLALAAPVVGKTPEAVVTALVASGVTVADPAVDSVASLSAGDRGKQMGMLKVLLAEK